ncbi:MAG TPA: adenosine deaminase, partial [Terriglobales bacterium]|nr:adenosine deaminase [Terriglobales bacterium]
MRTCIAAAAVYLLIAGAAPAQSPTAQSTPASRADSGELRAARYLDHVRSDPSLLLEFVRRMPKGGDLHNHLSGAVYAESYLRYAAQDNLCLNRQTLELAQATPAQEPAGGDGHAAAVCDSSKNLVPARQALSDSVLYRETINAWSMRSFHANNESAADHFFDSFRKFGPATRDHVPEMLAEVVSRAGHENVQYLELILDPTKKQPAWRVGVGMGLHDNDFAALRRQLLDKQIDRVVAAARLDLDDAEKKMAQILRCGTLDADPGCDVTVRYIYEVHRALPPDQVFAEMVAGFEMANADPRIVAVNLVMPEDAYVSMRDFDLHMKMLAYLRIVYPKVRLTLHAGELAPQLVPPEGLRFHIRESVEVGHAERIGHGDDIMHERDPIGLLKEMARRRVLVEICLTSNDLILGLRGAQHPLPMYLRYGVPVALATDDEGVSRSDLVREFVRAIQTYNLKYSDLKRMVRDSAEHSFLP